MGSGQAGPATGQLAATGEGSNQLYQAPFFSYSLMPGELLSIPDLGATAGSGLKTITILPSIGPPPVALATIFNDAGAAGTQGFTEDSLDETSALTTGEVAVLLAPADPVNFRFNIGVRGLPGGTLTATLRDSSGAVRTSVTINAPAFVQDTASGFMSGLPGAPGAIGPTIGASDTITITATNGSVFVYGVTADNRTNDSSFQLARRVAP
jgi:hypothetical protein